MKFSTVGQFLSGNSGILQLMDDLGAAHNQNRKIYMLGGRKSCPHSRGSSVSSILYNRQRKVGHDAAVLSALATDSEELCDRNF